MHKIFSARIDEELAILLDALSRKQHKTRKKILEAMRAYIDSDILIWHLRRESEALKFLRRMRNDPQNILCLGALREVHEIVVGWDWRSPEVKAR